MQAGLVAVFFRHLEQLGVVRQFAGELADGDNDIVERFFFTAQFLGLLRVVPDGWIF